jgi:adenylate kinase family enzyme
MNTTVIIVGTPCSGKSTISKRICEELNIKLITELNVVPINIFGIRNEYKKCENNVNVLIEHVEILSYIEEINIYSNKVIVILLNVSDNILNQNLEKRKSQNIQGDYLKYDILYIKKDIEEKFKNINIDCVKYVADINAYEDYNLEYNKIISILSANMNK